MQGACALPPQVRRHALPLLALGAHALLSNLQLLAVQGPCPAMGVDAEHRFQPQSDTRSTQLRMPRHRTSPSRTSPSARHYTLRQGSGGGIPGVGHLEADVLDLQLPPGETCTHVRPHFLRPPVPLSRSYRPHQSTRHLPTGNRVDARGGFDSGGRTRG